MPDFTPDNVKIYKRVLRDMLEEGVEKVLQYQGEDVIKECLRNMIDYISELERLPGTINHYIEARKQLDESLEYLKELCVENHT